MPSRNSFFMALGLAVLGLSLAFGIQFFFNKEGRTAVYSQVSESGFSLISPAFRDGALIPPQYSCKGQNVNPPLNIIDKPANTKSMALIMHDPDAAGGDFTHWIIWDISAAIESIAVNSVPVGALQGPNDAGKNAYTGPCPPAGTGTHRYIFELYALDSSLGLDHKANRQRLEQSMEGKIIEKTVLTGLFEAD